MEGPGEGSGLVGGAFGEEGDVAEGEVDGGGVDFGGGFAPDEGGVGDVDVVNATQAGESGGLDAGIASAADDVGDVYVLELGDEFCLLGVGLVADVGIGALEDDGLVLDVAHNDVADPDVLGLSAAAYGALEAQTGVGAGHAAVLAYDSAHAADVVTADDESAVTVKRGGVAYEYVLATTDLCAFPGLAALEAVAVVTTVDRGVDNEDAVAVGEVDGVGVLGIPGGAYSDAVDDDVHGVVGMDMEAGRVLEGDTSQEDAVAAGCPKEVVAHTFLFLGGCGYVLVAVDILPGEPLGAVLAKDASGLAETVPLDVADLGALDISPSGT